MKQNNARKVKIIRGMSLPKAKRSPEVRYYIGWDNCKKKTAKQGQNICSSGKPTSLFMILLCFIWKKCEKLLMPGRSLCNQFRIVPGTLHSDPPNTWRPLLFPDVLTNYFFSQVSCFLPVGRFRPAPSASFSIFASGQV